MKNIENLNSQRLFILPVFFGGFPFYYGKFWLYQNDFLKLASFCARKIFT